MAEVVDEALGIAKYYQRTKQRSITTDVPADLPVIVGVRDYLTQVVLNLVLNAVDATADQGRIHVSARDEDGHLVLSVEDDGRGISVADRCRLFQPYFTTKAHGTGLGLFVSRQILEEFSGTLAFVSEPGEGSTFVVRLAGRKTDQSPGAHALAAPHLSRRSPRSYSIPDRPGSPRSATIRPISRFLIVILIVILLPILLDLFFLPRLQKPNATPLKETRRFSPSRPHPHRG